MALFWGNVTNYLLFLDSEVITDQINDSTEAHIGEPMSSLGLLEGLLERGMEVSQMQSYHLNMTPTW